MRAMGSHQSAAMVSDAWLTPPEIIGALGGADSFDLDPCCPENMPWPTAKRMLTKADDGLRTPWSGRVWLNPPYSREAVKWLRLMAKHGAGTALVFARTETEWFWETVWRAASGIYFFEGRLHFHDVSGTRSNANAGAPSVLVSYGVCDAEILRSCSLPGRWVPL